MIKPQVMMDQKFIKVKSGMRSANHLQRDKR